MKQNKCYSYTLKDEKGLLTMICVARNEMVFEALIVDTEYSSMVLYDVAAESTLLRRNVLL
jgi:hypothetical protein